MTKWLKVFGFKSLLVVMLVEVSTSDLVNG